MKFRVQGTDYDVRDLVQGAPIGDVRDLKKITKGMLDRVDDGPAFQGVSPATFSAMFVDLGEKAAAGEIDEAKLLDDDNFLLHMQALIWLAKRREDWGATWDAVAGRVPMNGWQFIPDEDDEPEVAQDDPKAVTPDSVPEDAQPNS